MRFWKEGSFREEEETDTEGEEKGLWDTKADIVYREKKTGEEVEEKQKKVRRDKRWRVCV